MDQITRALRLRPHAFALVLLLFGAASCGNRADDDDREWYTKAPLDRPGLTIEAEEPSEMSELGEPRALVTQQEANFIAPARPRVQQQGGQEPAPPRQ